MSKRYIPQTPNNDFVYPNNDRVEYDQEIVHNINDNVVSGTVSGLTLSYDVLGDPTELILEYDFSWLRNNAEIWVRENGYIGILSIHMLTPDQEYFKPWRMIDSLSNSNPAVTGVTSSVARLLSPSDFQVPSWPIGVYTFEFRFIGLKENYVVCQTATLIPAPTATPTPTPTATFSGCTCTSYTATNDSLEAAAEVQWQSCSDGLIISNIIAPGTGIGFCACDGSVSVRSGSATIADIGPCGLTPTPTPTQSSTPTPTPTLATPCVINYGASMAPCIGGTLDEYMEGYVNLSSPAPAEAIFTLRVGYIPDTVYGNCNNVLTYEDLTVTVAAGDTDGLLTCPYAPFISSSGATICTVELYDGPYSECPPPPTATPTATSACTSWYLRGSTMSGELLIVQYNNCAGAPQEITLGWSYPGANSAYICAQAGSVVIIELPPDGEATNTFASCI